MPSHPLIRNTLRAVARCLPLLAIGFVAGIVISLAQIVTSIQDTAFGTIPRLVVFVVGMLLLMPWMVQRMTSYTTALLGDFGRYAH